MKSRWNEAEARAAVAHWAGQGVGEALALRTYSARLLGADPSLVLHGGGNTSVKTTMTDVFGAPVEVLCVKGSGWDLATIEPAGHPAVALAPLLRLWSLETLSDEAMVNAQRQALMDTAAPNPSVETLLHAFIGETFIDHTHANAVLALANQPDGAALIEEVFGERVACVPYVMPGFDLARAAVAAYESRPGLEGLILLNHGVFSFGATARESYERMIALVDTAERHVESRRSARRPAAPPPALSEAPGAPLAVLRAALGAAGPGAGAPRHWILDLRRSPAIGALLADPQASALAVRGVATPDHVIRTKRVPLVLPPPGPDLAAWRMTVDAALAAFAADYRAYFERCAARVAEPKTCLDPLPRLALIPGLGLAGIGRTSGEAAIAADIGEAWARVVMDAEAVGTFTPLGEADTFAMEYWSLEQAKLGKGSRRRLEGRVVAVTGGAGAIGAAIGAAFAAEGAEIALIDRDAAAASAAAGAIGRRALAVVADLCEPAAASEALEAVCARFGGLDILVCNAGVAIGGTMSELAETDLRQSLEINFFAHQRMASTAVRLLKAQGLGGVLLFNVSKQALNPGPGFGAYGTAKAAMLALMRQYALEHGAEGIRANAVNPDRIRSGLLDEAMIAERAAARGVDAQAYMRGNLLGREVTAADVAQAFLFAALMEATTGAVLTVDGGNVAAMVR